MGAQPFIAKIVKNNFMKNPVKFRISLFVLVASMLVSCHLFNTKNTINSNENYGFSNTPRDYETGTGGIATKAVVDNKNENNFVEGSKDLPLAAGLSKISDDGIDFDLVGGNIVSISYKSKNDLKEVKDFYVVTLPQLGWNAVSSSKKSTSSLKFKRDHEKLEIEFVNKNGAKIVRFFIEASSK